MSAPQLSAQARSLLPAHVAVIMDGNGRWAKQRNLPRIEGHRHGAESVRAVVRAAGEVGIKYLTLYAFSVENWSRPKEEGDTLMKYLDRYLRNEIGELVSQVSIQILHQRVHLFLGTAPVLHRESIESQIFDAHFAGRPHHRPDRFRAMSMAFDAGQVALF